MTWFQWLLVAHFAVNCAHSVRRVIEGDRAIERSAALICLAIWIAFIYGVVVTFAMTSAAQ